MALEKIDIDTLDPAATIVVATGNAHKLTEIEAILGKVMPEVRFVALGQLGDFEDPEENGTTFLENAIIKAQAAVEETGLMAIADDSGLVVDALDGEPGAVSYTHLLPRALSRSLSTSSPRAHICKSSGSRTRTSLIRLPYARWSAPRLNRCATTASIPWYSAARIFRCSWGLFAMRWVTECAW